MHCEFTNRNSSRNEGELWIVKYAPHWSLPIIFVNIYMRNTTWEKQWCFNNDSENNGKNYLIEIKLDSYKLF